MQHFFFLIINNLKNTVDFITDIYTYIYVTIFLMYEIKNLKPKLKTIPLLLQKKKKKCAVIIVFYDSYSIKRKLYIHNFINSQLYTIQKIAYFIY